MTGLDVLLPTPSQTVGPYLSLGLAPLAREELVPPESPGALLLHGSVRDGSGEPVPDAVVELWQPGADGQFAATPEAWSGFGRCLADADGGYRFVTVKPGRVPLRSGILQAPHVEMIVMARGLLRPVRTRVYFPDEEVANAADPVLLAIGDDRRHTVVAVGDGDRLRFDVHLQGPSETVFFGM